MPILWFRSHRSCLSSRSGDASVESTVATEHAARIWRLARGPDRMPMVSSSELVLLASVVSHLVEED